MLVDLVDERLDLARAFAASLAPLRLAVKQLPRVAKDHLEAPSGARIFDVAHLDAVSELRFELFLQAVVKPPVSSTSAVRNLVGKGEADVVSGQRQRFVFVQVFYLPYRRIGQDGRVHVCQPITYDSTKTMGRVYFVACDVCAVLVHVICNFM